MFFYCAALCSAVRFAATLDKRLDDPERERITAAVAAGTGPRVAQLSCTALRCAALRCATSEPSFRPKSWLQRDSARLPFGFAASADDLERLALHDAYLAWLKTLPSKAAAPATAPLALLAIPDSLGLAEPADADAPALSLSPLWHWHRVPSFCVLVCRRAHQQSSRRGVPPGPAGGRGRHGSAAASPVPCRASAVPVPRLRAADCEPLRSRARLATVSQSCRPLQVWQRPLPDLPGKTCSPAKLAGFASLATVSQSCKALPLPCRAPAQRCTLAWLWQSPPKLSTASLRCASLSTGKRKPL